MSGDSTLDCPCFVVDGSFLLVRCSLLVVGRSLFVVRCSELVRDGESDWTAGILACNAVASAASNLSGPRSHRSFSCFALMQAGRLRSSRIRRLRETTNDQQRTTNNE